MSFQSLSLSPALLGALADLDYTTPTPIQTLAIPPALAGRDLIASAATGTGKTAAFLLPALARLETQKPTPRSAPRVLILTPTRELAQQILANARGYSKNLRLMTGAILGGMPFGAQIRMLSQRVDLLVATPGRLIDHLDRGNLQLDRVELLVLDEADRMLDMGFVHAVKKIASQCPKQRQTLMFTATWDDRLANLSKDLLNDPERVAVAQSAATPAAIAQRVHLADDASHKRRLLRDILRNAGDEQMIVFAGTKRRVDRLAEELINEGFKVGALHGDMKQNQRSRTIDDLKAKRIKVIVATDVAARGIDVPALAAVINFDLPNVPEDYVHRIGRTGRNGMTGHAVSLVGPDDVPLLGAIEKFTKQTIERAVIKGLEPTTQVERYRPDASPASHRKPVRRFGGGGSNAARRPGQGQGQGRPGGQQRRHQA